MKRFFTLVLALLMTVTLFAGCSGKKPNDPVGTTPPINDSDSNSGTAGDNVEPEPPAQVDRTWNELPKEQYDAVINILGRGGTGVWDTVDLAVKQEDIGGDTLASAVYNRNQAVENRYDVTIAYNGLEGDNYADQMAVMAMSNVNDYALYDIPLVHWGAGVVMGYFKDLYDVEELRLEESWWDQRFAEDLTLYGQLYGILSDATYLDKEATWGVFFNKEMFSVHNLNVDPYQLVRDGEWTYDQLLTLAKEVNFDEGADGVMDLNTGDIYGISGEYGNTPFLMQAAGIPVCTYEDGEIQLNLTKKREEADTVFQAVYEMVADSKLTYNAENHHAEGAWGRGRNFFSQQQCLFFIGGISNLHQYFGNFEHDYGVLPLPKRSVEQENYYNAVHQYNCPCFSIPLNAEDAAMSAIIMQAMACRGQNGLLVTFYDTILKGQSVRDPDSVEMLDLIYASRCYDLGTIYSIGDFVSTSGGHLAELIRNGQKDQLNSTIDSYAGIAEDQIDKLLAFYDKNME